MPAAGLSSRTRSDLVFALVASRNAEVTTAHALIAVDQESSPARTRRSRSSTRSSSSVFVTARIGRSSSFGASHFDQRPRSSPTLVIPRSSRSVNQPSIHSPTVTPSPAAAPSSVSRPLSASSWKCCAFERACSSRSPAGRWIGRLFFPLGRRTRTAK